LSWIGPYNMNFSEVREMIVEGPRKVKP